MNAWAAPSKMVKLDPAWTPVRAFAEVMRRPYPFFLDAGLDPERLGRRSFVGSDPFAVLHVKRDVCRIDYPRRGVTETIVENPFSVLKKLLKAMRREGESPFPLAFGGAVGYLAYDLFTQIERIPLTALDDLDMPDMFFGFYDAVCSFDHKTGEAFLSISPVAGEGEPPEDFGIFSSPPVAAELPGYTQAEDADLRFNQTSEEFKEAVTRAKEHIAAGDVYQVNLSRRLTASYDGDPVGFYLNFRKLSPAPFGACLFPDGCAVLSNSPERYLLIDGCHIETRPIKGTRPRGRDAGEDERLAWELANSEKDNAEHLMIVDLERNDLGRVSVYDSVRVPEFRIIESYANVHHMVSTVSGRVHPAKDAVDCIRNSFPGGSITGAPKVRAMEIIDRLEPTARGVYCGSIGYIDFSGRVDLNIAIRTAIAKDGRIHFQVGGGIVADSDPEGEYQETVTKAQSFMKALTGKGRLWGE